MTDMHREAFEQAMRESGQLIIIRDDFGGVPDYRGLDMQKAWIGWKAALRYRDEQEKQA